MCTFDHESRFKAEMLLDTSYHRNGPKGILLLTVLLAVSLSVCPKRIPQLLLSTVQGHRNSILLSHTGVVGTTTSSAVGVAKLGAFRAETVYIFEAGGSILCRWGWINYTSYNLYT